MNRQYEACEHRHGSGLMGTYVDHYSTPCPLCAAHRDMGREAKAMLMTLALLVLVVVLAVVLS